MFRAGFKDGQAWSRMFKDDPGRSRFARVLVAFKYASSIIQICFKFASSMSQACFKHNSSMVQACIRNASSLLQQRFKLSQVPSPVEGLLDIQVMIESTLDIMLFKFIYINIYIWGSLKSCI